jgi:AsmA protein
MRLVLRLIGILVSIVVLGVAALFVIPTDRLANMAAQQFEGVTGRSVVFSGDVRPMIYPSIGVRTGAVSLSNAPWSDSGPMFRAEALEIALDLSAILRGDVAIRRIAAQDPVIVLERLEDGRANWEFGDTTAARPDGGGTASGGLASFTIDEAVISNAAVRFDDRQGGQSIDLSGLDGTLTLPDFAGVADLAVSASINGQRIAATASIAEFAAAMSGQVSGVSLRAEAGGSTAEFSGRAGLTPLAAEGQFTLDLADPASVFAALGQAAPALPQGLGASTMITLAPAGSVHLRETTLRAGGNTVTGAADLTFDGPRPRLVAQLSAGQLNLADIVGGGGAASGNSGTVTPGWPRDRIDASALGAIDAEVTFAADGVDLGAIALDRVRMGLNIDRARAVFDLREIGLYDGRVTGEFVINARSGLSTGGNLRAEGLGLLPLLRETAGFERLAGTGNAALRFLAVGDSVDAMMRSLSGEGRFDLGQGEIIGFDLAGMLRNLDMSYMGEGNRTIYRAISGSFTIVDGVLSNDDLTLDAPRVTASGEGTVNLGARQLDYRVTPVALADTDGAGGLRVPLQARGPWDDLRFSIDVEGLAQERLRAEQENLEAQARERAEQEVIDRLELDPQEGESIEDAARRRIEQEAADGLRGLLFGR